MEVTPPYNVQAGEYDFHVEAQAPKAKAEKDLKVVLTGTYGFEGRHAQRRALAGDRARAERPASLCWCQTQARAPQAK